MIIRRWMFTLYLGLTVCVLVGFIVLGVMHR